MLDRVKPGQLWREKSRRKVYVVDHILPVSGSINIRRPGAADGRYVGLYTLLDDYELVPEDEDA